MPRVSRRRRIAAAPNDIWRVIADPYHLPRWWPKTQRVENVSDVSGKGRKWTQVLETRDGRGIRADFRCVSSATDERYVYEQLLEGTPFAAFLRALTTDIRLEADGATTRVTLAIDQQLKGLSRFGSLMMRRATRRTLSEALDGLAGAVGDPGRS